MKILVLVLLLIIVMLLLILFGTIVLYNIAIAGYNAAIRIASLWNPKAKALLRGRKHAFEDIAAHFDFPGQKKVWIHCASLGEFEQGQPVLEKIRSMHPEAKILLTFFSPSGYEARKNTPLADCVTYLPSDSATHARKFLSLVKPDVAIFIKYEFWAHYILGLKRNAIPFFLVSAVFRKKQLFFFRLGRFFRMLLKQYTQIFVQDPESLRLLEKRKIRNVQQTGDTRLDRVLQIAGTFHGDPYLERFCKGYNVLVAGSTWPLDNRILARAFYHSLVYENFKLIIAPHDVDGKMMEKTLSLFKRYSLRYTQLNGNSDTLLEARRVLIIDRLGVLSGAYKYGDLCYIGGGFNKGIHNTLEAAVYGKPLCFGPKYKKFREAVALIKNGAAFDILDAESILTKVNFMNEFPFVITGMGKASRKYVQQNAGATLVVMQALSPYL